MIADDVLHHRLGMIPLISDDAPKYKTEDDCDCDDGCDRCQATFTLKARNEGDEPILITDAQLRPSDPRVRPASLRPPRPSIAVPMSDSKSSTPISTSTPTDENEGILLVKLRKNQEISITAKAVRGTGSQNAKYNPVALAAYRPLPSSLELNEAMLGKMNPEDRREFAASCPSRVFGYDEKNDKVVIEEAGRCNFCRDCFVTSGKLQRKHKQTVSDPNNCLVKITASQKDFVFAIEGSGALRPEDVLLRALDALSARISGVRALNRDLLMPSSTKEATDATKAEQKSH